MRHLFEDLLPDALLDRRTKASFNASIVGPATQAFLDGWTGAGVDPDLVDPDRLADNWRTGSPHALSFLLMQQAFLAQFPARDVPPPGGQ
jgi:asparagine synthase (glutamine-hydrolysing)